MVTAASGWLLVYDNLSVIPNWFSDGLCRLATGGGLAGRALWSNNERSVLQARQPTQLNGIDEFVCRQDLADRCVCLYLPPIDGAQRQVEGELWREFQSDAAAILGGLLDAIVVGLASLPLLRTAELPRMADFARLGEAVGRGLGWPDGAFLDAYAENRRAATVGSLEDSLVAAALFESAEWGEFDNWTCTASELLARLGTGVDPKVRSSVRWPKTHARWRMSCAGLLRSSGCAGYPYSSRDRLRTG